MSRIVPRTDSKEHITVATKLNITNLDVLLALDAPRQKKATSTSAQPTGNRDARIEGVITAARNTGMTVLQAETRLDGWTRVHKGKVTEDVTPEQVARMIDGRAKRNRELAVAGIDHNPDYLTVKVFGSTDSRPSNSARLGGRFFVVSLDKLDEIDEADYSNMIDQVDEHVAIALTSVRPVAPQSE